MSLDVYLTGETVEVPCRCSYGHEHMRKSAEEVYSANITHNLINMAEAAGIYVQLWRPDEINVTKAAQIIEPLRAGLALLKARPNEFKKYDSTNGWGLYEHFVPWVEKYLAACEQHPGANVGVSR